MLHEPVILFRYFNLETKEEQAICAKHFKTVQSRSDVENIKNKIVIGRYSVLPFYKELENDLSYFNSKLINSFREHRYIADLKNWALDVDVELAFGRGLADGPVELTLRQSFRKIGIGFHR